MPASTKINHYNIHDSNQSSVQAISYIGPKALFDPDFIPPQFLIRENKISTIQSMLTDAIEDKYPLNINIFGIKGSGKNLLLNYSLKNLYLNLQKTMESDSKDILKCELSPELLSSWNISSSELVNTKNSPITPSFGHNIDLLSSMGVVFLRVDCNQKECNQIFFHLLIQLGQIIKKTLRFQDISLLSDAKLWNLLKLLIQKIDRPIILYFQKPDELIHTQLLSKFYNFSKNQRNLQILTSMDCGLSRGVLKPIDGMDHKIFLDQYSGMELHQITKERTEMAFQKPLNGEAIQIIVDYILDFDFKVPGSCMNYLKALYPVAQQHGEIHPENIRDLSQFHFENFSFDAISMADFVSNTTFEDRLFLDYLVNSFHKTDRYYITYSEMFKAYKMSCEELGYPSNKNEFHRSLKKITDANIFRPTICIRSPKVQPINGVWPVAHYLTMSIDEMAEIMKVSFGDLCFDEQDNSKFDDDFENPLY